MFMYKISYASGLPGSVGERAMLVSSTVTQESIIIALDVSSSTVGEVLKQPADGCWFPTATDRFPPTIMLAAVVSEMHELRTIYFYVVFSRTRYRKPLTSKDFTPLSRTHVSRRP